MFLPVVIIFVLFAFWWLTFAPILDHCLGGVVRAGAFWRSLHLVSHTSCTVLPLLVSPYLVLFFLILTKTHHLSVTMAIQQSQHTCPEVESKP